MVLCYVEADPHPGSPAHEAGLRAGDAILSFGSATSFEQLPSQIVPYASVLLTSLDRSGVLASRYLTPRPFDPGSHSLLGCKVVGACPPQFCPHPAEHVVPSASPSIPSPLPPSSRSTHVVSSRPLSTISHAPLTYQQEVAAMCASCSRQPSAWHEEDSPPACLQLVPVEDTPSEAGSIDAPTLAMTSLPDELLPLPSAPPTPPPPPPPLPDQLRPSKRRPSEEEPEELEAPEPRRPLGGAKWCCRLTLTLASTMQLAHGATFLAAPYLGDQSDVMVSALGEVMWKLAAKECVDASLSPRRLSEGTGLTLQLFGRSALVAACTQLLLTVTGLLLALTPSTLLPSLRAVLYALYTLCAIFAWLSLAAAAMYCLSFELEAEMLVAHYWRCVGSGVQAGRPEWAGTLAGVRGAAALCASGAASAVVGLFATCQLIGWHVVLRVGVLIFSAMSAVVGLTVLLLGLALTHDEVVDSPWDMGLCAMGGSVLLFSLLGHLAAKGERLLLLLLYASLQTLCALLLAVVSAVLFSDGLEEADSWLTEQWKIPPSQQRKDRVHAVVQMLQGHRLLIAVVAILILFLLIMNITMAFALRWLLSSSRSHDYETIRERAARPSRNTRWVADRSRCSGEVARAPNRSRRKCATSREARSSASDWSMSDDESSDAV